MADLKKDLSNSLTDKDLVIIRQSQLKVAHEFIASMARTDKGSGVGSKEAQLYTDKLVAYAVTGKW